MPLRYTEDPASLQSAKDIPGQYVIFYSSRDQNGRMWCPVRRRLGAPDLCDPTILRPQQDCRDVEKIVEETFGKDDGPAALVVYVGQKPECVYLIGTNFVRSD